MQLNKDYWTSRYREQQTQWDLGEASPPLKAYIDQLKDKTVKILIPGAGNAYEAEYLLQKGFEQVYVVDIAKEPLENLKHRLPSFPQEQLMCNNFFDLKDTFDLILEQTFFCAIPVEKRQLYAFKMKSSLKPGGSLAGVFFDTEFASPGPPFGGNREEYISYFDPLFEIKIMETCYNSIPPRKGNELFFIFKNK